MSRSLGCNGINSRASIWILMLSWPVLGTWNKDKLFLLGGVKNVITDLSWISGALKIILSFNKYLLDSYCIHTTVPRVPVPKAPAILMVVRKTVKKTKI